MDEICAHRFWNKVEMRGPDECWAWNGFRNPQGYGRFGRVGRSHRVSFQLAKGPIPDGMCVCHSCDHPWCVNPSHLFLGTLADNVADKVSKCRQAKGDRNGSRTHPERRPRGERCHSAKLDEQRVREIFALRSGGALQQDIANRFGMSIQLISKLLSGGCWAHLGLAIGSRASQKSCGQQKGNSMEIKEQFEALVNKGVAKALEPYSEAIIALAKLVRSAEPEANEDRPEAPRAKRKATGPRVNKEAIEAVEKFSLGQQVRYHQGRGTFEAVVYEKNSSTGELVLKRTVDGKIVERPASKVIEA